MPKIRCSNCEKSVNYRDKLGRTYTVKNCKATGEKIAGKDYYLVRHCSEFLPRKEYVIQFVNPLDKALEVIEKGKKIKDLIDPV